VLAIGLLDLVPGDLEATAAGTIVERDEVEILLRERAEARHRGDFAAADDIRRSLDQAGIELRDTPGGTVWKPRPAASGRPVRDDG
jgi:cysteinyl-tRNA synthetase